jgi:membrane protease YdiL (CAAX protease family)
VVNGLRTWFAPERAAVPDVLEDPLRRRTVVVELTLLLATTLGLSGLRSLLSLLNSYQKQVPLNQQSVALNAPRATVNLIDLGYQLASVVELGAWGGLGLYLLWRGGIRLRDLGLDRGKPAYDAALATGLAAAIGIPGLGLYLVARAAGQNLTVLPSTLGDTWWRAPVLVLAALGNAWAEEVIVVGYLISRLRQLGWGENRSVLASSVLRGSYHLYQGFGGFIGNVIMGLVFGRVWQRKQRLWALIAAHALIDVTAFVGYALLRGYVRWLP